MRETNMTLAGRKVRVVTCQTVVVGTGAAGFNAALRLWEYGHRDVVMVTEHVNAGTSRNTGSDKQTYYKLTMAGQEPDSVHEMAQTLFDGHCVDGEHALAEAAMSAECFMRLVELGVPFPRTKYGEFVGYKTDHDPRRRATSVGPYTSRLMTEKLEAAVRGCGIPILEHLLVVKVVTHEGASHGLVCLDFSEGRDEDCPFTLFCCRNVVYAVGGPCGMYKHSVYPAGCHGSSGVAFEAGAVGKNLTEWQYSFGSIDPPWTLSGSYMQVLPRFFSTDADGGDEREFLFDFFDDLPFVLSRVFLKGYQMPFDVRKVAKGSSIIDILVYLESCKGRRVYLDYRQNPLGKPVDFDTLEDEARDYLQKVGACFGTPIERLWHMNRPAYDFYMDRGVDLAKEPLEVVMSVQHNNGGLAVNEWWETDVRGLFAVGEVAGSHGVYRPGGAALNSGQVGSTRAAQAIARYRGTPPDQAAFAAAAETPLREALSFAAQVRAAKGDVAAKTEEVTARMSRHAAFFRNRRDVASTLEAARRDLEALPSGVAAPDMASLKQCFWLRDILISQVVYLSAMVDYIDAGGPSRGSVLVTDEKGQKPYPALPDAFTYRDDDGFLGDKVQQVRYQNGDCTIGWRAVRPLPTEDLTFENVWRSYRETQNIDG
ncbi:FAD-binding protein [Ruminococcaceae bacterium OttesenSCG-928-D13]|nr:FAD-binding protein [Ruminococcaceae bacterium OttesenSCG-928-D13]